MAYDRLLAPGLYYFLSNYQSNIINLFNRSTTLARCVGAGRAGRLFCSLWIAGSACGGRKCALQRRDGSVGVPLNCPVLYFNPYRKGINGGRNNLNPQRKAFDVKRRHFNAPRKVINGYHRAIDGDKSDFNSNHNTIDDNHMAINGYHTNFNAKHGDFDGKHSRLNALQNNFDGVA